METDFIQEGTRLQRNTHFNSVQICFWLHFDSRSLIHMNSNEVSWMRSAFWRRIPPAIRVHATVSHTQTRGIVSGASECFHTVNEQI